MRFSAQHRRRQEHVAFVVDNGDERLVKSTERVRDIGEVFTPIATIKEMLDLLPQETWASHPSPTFLEPACGDGNFLVAILNRKLDRIALEHSEGKLAAGDDVDGVYFHALEALASIYAVDISVDNVVGGTLGHERGARTRLLDVFDEWHVRVLGKRLTERSSLWRAAEWIVEHNILVGNMLPYDAAGKSTGRDKLPIIGYTFVPDTRRVVLHKTTLGDVMKSEQQKVAAQMVLSGPAEPEPLWSGPTTNLADADRVEAPKLRGPARNGTGRR